MTNFGDGSRPPLSCDDVDELLAAYVLGALDPDETQSVDQHIQAGREHDDRLIELRALTFALDAVGEDRPVSPQLSARIAGIAGTAARGRGDDGEGSQATAPTVVESSAGSAWRGRIGGGALRWMAAAAVIAVAFILGSVVAPWQPQGVHYAYALNGSDGARVHFSGVIGEEPVAVTMSGLDRLPSELAYELWAIRDERWHRIGICNTNPTGSWAGDFPFAVHEGDGLAVTIEPSEGSERPTAEPVLIADF